MEQFQVDGVDVRVEGHGSETLLMLHGWPDTLALWDAQVEALRDRFRCARFTWPGFDGASRRTQPTLQDTVALVLKVVDRLCPGQRVTLLLHDWGCLFGYPFAMRHPDRVARWARAPADPATLGWQMNWPYHLAWFGGQDALPRHTLPFDPQCPMLFVYGTRKPFPFHTEAWAQAIARRPGSRVEAFDTGHWVMVRGRERFNQVLRQWLLAGGGH